MKLTIDNRTIEVGKDLTLLQAADQHGIYIPRMCAHPELEPYGGCRLCIVEVEGMRGYPASCTTRVTDGMVVRTNTNSLQEMRKDLVQLILSEHPSACLLCEDIEGCSKFQQTIRKVGVTTGCRWCPKDLDCELQRVVETFDIQELTLPGLYRDLSVEKYDPFFDRDYNLCIYCGRCVRICNEYRNSSVLSLRQRGKQTTIGPAFETNHTDAGCEYCGACVSVCPTGAMSEKSRKWWGIPDSYKPSVCPLCSFNCEIQTLTLKDKIVGTIPTGIPHESAGELCVKGRFCLSELVNRTERLLEPQFLYPEGYGIINWPEAKKQAGEIMKSVKPGRSALFISPDLTNEEYSAASVFAEKVLKTKEITSACLDKPFLKYSSLAIGSTSLKEVKKADFILSLFVNGNYNYAPLTMAVKESAVGKVPYWQVGWINDTTSRFAKGKIIPKPGEETAILDELFQFISNGSCGDELIAGMAKDLLKAKKPLIICGPTVISTSNCIDLLEGIEKVVDKTGAKLFMPGQYGNLKGMLSFLSVRPVEEVMDEIEKGEIDLVYLVGDVPFTKRPRVKKLIYQNAFPPPDTLQPDLLLAASLWGEVGGSWPGLNGTPKKVKAASKPHDYALPHIKLLSLLASVSSEKGVKVGKGSVKGKPQPKLPDIKKLVNEQKHNIKGGKKLPFILVNEESPHKYQGSDLGNLIGGFGSLVQPGQLMVNQSDANTVGVVSGEIVEVSSPEGKHKFPVVIRKNIPKGILYITSQNNGSIFKTNPCYVNIRRNHV